MHSRFANNNTFVMHAQIVLRQADGRALVLRTPGARQREVVLVDVRIDRFDAIVASRLGGGRRTGAWSVGALHQHDFGAAAAARAEQMVETLVKAVAVAAAAAAAVRSRGQVEFNVRIVAVVLVVVRHDVCCVRCAGRGRASVVLTAILSSTEKVSLCSV